MSDRKKKAATYMRGWHARNKERVNSERRAKWAAMSPEEKEEARAAQASSHARHRDERHRKNAIAYRANPDPYKLRAQAWGKEHPEALTERTARRRAILRNAMPRWVDKNALRSIYSEAKARSHATGIEHHVDHVFPLQHERFNGLHVPWNLQVLTAADNLAKGNRLWV